MSAKFVADVDAGTAEALFWKAERYCYAYLGRRERSPDQVVEGLAPVWTAAL